MKFALGYLCLRIDDFKEKETLQMHNYLIQAYIQGSKVLLLSTRVIYRIPVWIS